MTFRDDLPLWEQIRECLRMLDTALSECKRRGHAWVMAELDYKIAKYEVSERLRLDGIPVTHIQTIIKGHPDVAEKYAASIDAQAEYENAREARNVWKKKLDTLREQYSREWSEAGRS